MGSSCQRGGESATTLQITLQSSASTNVGDYGAEGPIGGANVLRPSVTYGPLPSTYPSVTSASFDTANIPRIWLRAGVEGGEAGPATYGPPTRPRGSIADPTRA